MDSLVLEWQLDGRSYTHTVTKDRSSSIGRQADCNIVLAFPTISRRHAQVFIEGNVFYVRNQSVNQIHINDQVHLATGQQAPLQPGDVFRMGPVQFKVSAPANEPAPQLKIKCPTCGRAFDYNPQAYCRYDGTHLSTGETVYG